jgi:sulfur-carrier protein adenylyltransferase/sulfurtransferase
MEIEIDVQQCKERLAEVLLVDCRRHVEWDICRIEGALLCPLDTFAAHVDALREQAGARRIVVYCHTGRRSLVAAHMLRKAGADAVSLRGGIDAWSDIDPSVARY